MLGLEKLYLLPAGDPPLKTTPFTTASQRLEMLRLAQMDFPTLDIDDREIRRGGPSYMVDTLREVREENPGLPILLLLGQDAVNHLHRWRQWRQLFTLAHIVTFPRPGAEPDYVSELATEIERRESEDFQSLKGALAGRFLRLELELIDISATAIQDIIRSGGSPRSMLPASVMDYIDEKQLYLPR